jgi:hypothetical protein
MFNAWDPDVFVDLHTTDGSYHGYALTYAPPLNPASPLGVYARDSMLPILRERMRSRHGFETFDYGDFISEDTLSKGWETFDSRPRFGTNYYGLRSRISFLSEAFSHDPFEKRVASTYAFTKEILSLVAEKSSVIKAHVTAASQSPKTQSEILSRPPIALRSRMIPAPDSQIVVAEVLEKTGDTLRTAPGVRRGYRRTGKFRQVKMPVFERFQPTLLRPQAFGYLIAPEDTALVTMLRMHGIAVQTPFRGQRAVVETFTIDSLQRSARLFQGHNEMRVFGKWDEGMSGGKMIEQTIPNGSLYVSTFQPLGLLVQYLLEPDSDDGFTVWNFFDSRLRAGAAFPVRRATLIIE